MSVKGTNGRAAHAEPGNHNHAARMERERHMKTVKTAGSILAAVCLAFGALGCGQDNKSEWPTQAAAENAPVKSGEVAPPSGSSNQCYYYWKIYWNANGYMRAGYMNSCGYEVCEYIGISVSRPTGCNNYAAGEGGFCAGGLPFC